MSSDSKRIEVIGKHGFFGVKKIICDYIESNHKVIPLQVKSWVVVGNSVEVSMLCESRDSALRLDKSVKEFSIPLSVMM